MGYNVSNNNTLYISIDLFNESRVTLNLNYSDHIEMVIFFKFKFKNYLEKKSLIRKRSEFR